MSSSFQGHEKEALNLMASYLPKDSANSSPYAEGGGLYAIGIYICTMLCIHVYIHL